MANGALLEAGTGKCEQMNMLKPPIVFFDFDNTITREDVLSLVIEEYSINQDWKVLEKAWRSGEIGSRECLEGQLQFVRVTRSELVDFIVKVPLDPFFLPLLKTLKQNQIPSIIVSDSFSFIIQTILEHHGLFRESVFANELRFKGDRLVPSFPFVSYECRRCAHCKKRHLLKHENKTRIYVGDGLSDICPAMEADIVFAKKDLAQYLGMVQKPHNLFDDLETVSEFFKKSENLFQATIN